MEILLRLMKLHLLEASEQLHRKFLNFRSVLVTGSALHPAPDQISAIPLIYSAFLKLIPHDLNASTSNNERVSGVISVIAETLLVQPICNLQKQRHSKCHCKCLFLLASPRLFERPAPSLGLQTVIIDRGTELFFSPKRVRTILFVY